MVRARGEETEFYKIRKGVSDEVAKRTNGTQKRDCLIVTVTAAGIQYSDKTCISGQDALNELGALIEVNTFQGRSNRG